MLSVFNLNKFKPSIALPTWLNRSLSPKKVERQDTLKSESSSSDDDIEEEVVTPKDMDELVKLIRIELGEYGLDSDKVNVKKIQKLMENYQSNSSDWEKYAHFDNNKYTRNLVDDGNGEFNLIVLAWNNGQKSPIHDHAGSHCIMKILDGELQEQLYEWPEESSAQTECCRKMNNYKNTVYSKDQVTYMHDNLGLHRVANYNSDKPALSLHLYTPPIKQAITFQEDSGAKRSGGNCTFYSIRGEKV